MMESFWLAFFPLFVAVDALGVMPMFTGLTSDVDRAAIPRLLIQSVVTAIAVAALFVLGGGAVMGYLGISVADFMIAGGIVLFVISISDLLHSEKVQRRTDPESLGAVPIGVPLMAGPAVFATSLLVRNQQGLFWCLVSIVVNMLLAGIIFALSPQITRLIGNSGTKVISKIASLFLAAIAVTLVRRGVIESIAAAAG